MVTLVRVRSIGLRHYLTMALVFLCVALLTSSEARQVEPLQALPVAQVATETADAPPVSSDKLANETPDLDGEPSTAAMDQYLTHILLAGVDSGDAGFDRGRTDTIMLVSLDPIGNKIKLTSFMRDLYVEIPGHGHNRINAAHAWGGMQLLIDTLNLNFGLALDRHVTIDFAGFERAIDVLGGVDVEVKDYEAPHIGVSGTGLQHLNGSQALHYVRLRYVGNSDYERTERQRRLLSAALERARQIPARDYIRLYREVEPYIRTNFSILETLRIGYVSYMLRDAEVETLRIPVDGTYEATYRQAMAVLVPDLEANVALLHEFLRPTDNGGEAQYPTHSIEP